MRVFPLPALRQTPTPANQAGPCGTEGEEPRSWVSWVGRWSSGDVDFTVRSSRVTWREGGDMHFLLISLLQTTGYRRGERGQKE